MLTTYTKAQLMTQWRLRRGLEPMRGDVTVELDGIDTEAIDEAEMMDWWHHVVATAPAGMLEAKDVSIRCSTKAANGGGTGCGITDGSRRPKGDRSETEWLETRGYARSTR